MYLNYTFADCPLGAIAIAATPKGICAVSLGDSEAVLQANLMSSYPTAKIERDDASLSQWASDLLRNLNGELPDLNLPLDVRATAFQQRVWEALRHIPYGSTLSYNQIARTIGQPTATRAVGGACASNPVALLIPCHRAIRSDGTLGGYRWGLERKQALLEWERSVAQNGKPCQDISAA